MIQPAPLLAALGLIATTGCQPPVVEAHIEPQHERCETPGSPIGDSKPGNLTVTGTATLEVTPNVADVTLELTATAPSPRAAVAKLRAREAAMRKNLSDEGMAAEESRSPRLPRGRHARRTVSVLTTRWSPPTP